MKRFYARFYHGSAAPDFIVIELNNGDQHGGIVRYSTNSMLHVGWPAFGDPVEEDGDFIDSADSLEQFMANNIERFL